jgi:hypothetical protein
MILALAVVAKNTSNATAKMPNIELLTILGKAPIELVLFLLTLALPKLPYVQCYQKEGPRVTASRNCR